jgi:hypothetical protein
MNMNRLYFQDAGGNRSGVWKIWTLTGSWHGGLERRGGLGMD